MDDCGRETYDALVVGGGFKGMMTAYGLCKQGYSVCIIEKQHQLGGIMTPIAWKGAEIDKGPQYFDGVSQVQKNILDEIMPADSPLQPLDYSYASYWNKKITNEFAIPDYRTLPKEEKSQVFFEQLSLLNDGHQDLLSLSDSIHPEANICRKYYQHWCKKFFHHDLGELSNINRQQATFFGRALLFDSDLSKELKKLPLLDRLLAIQKKNVSHETFNLYPVGKNVGFFNAQLISKLMAFGVNIKTAVSLTRLVSSKSNFLVELDSQAQIHAKNIHIAGPLESLEYSLLGTERLRERIYSVPILFYLISLNVSPELPFYLMDYSDHSISRVTNFSSYGNAIPSGGSVICVEAPTKVSSKQWTDPDTHFPILEAELQDLGVHGIEEHKVFRIPHTYRVALAGYEEVFDQVRSHILNEYGSKLNILTPHLLSRASIMDELLEQEILVG